MGPHTIARLLGREVVGEPPSDLVDFQHGQRTRLRSQFGQLRGPADPYPSELEWLGEEDRPLGTDEAQACMDRNGRIVSECASDRIDLPPETVDELRPITTANEEPHIRPE